APEQIAGPTSAPTTSAIPTQPTAGVGEVTSNGGGSVTVGDEAPSRTPWVVALAALIALAARASIRAARRDRHPAALQERWDHVLRHLARVGVDTSATRTPRSVVRDATDVLDDDGIAALTELAGAIEMLSYGRRDTPRPEATEVTRW